MSASRCPVDAETNGEPPAGTASPVRSWLCLGQPDRGGDDLSAGRPTPVSPGS